jgi:hypothetical protein
MLQASKRRGMQSFESQKEGIKQIQNNNTLQRREQRGTMHIIHRDGG